MENTNTTGYRFSLNKFFFVDLACVLWLSRKAMRAGFTIVLSRLHIANASLWAMYYTAGFVYFLLFLYVGLNKKLRWKKFMGLYMVCILFFGLTLAIHPDYLEWYQRQNFGVWYVVLGPAYGAIWSFLMIEMCEDPKRVFNNLRWSAIITGVYTLYRIRLAIKTGGYFETYTISGELSKRTYSLDVGYNMMFLCLLLLSSYFISKKKRWLAISVLPMLCALMYGSRGAFLSFFVFWGMYLVQKALKSRNALILVPTLITGFGLLTYNVNRILTAVALFCMNTLGIHSRTLIQIVNGSISDDNGRDRIYQLVKDAIVKKPFLGYGAFGDRPIVGPTVFWGYCHSIIYEMMIDFGVIIGVLILLWLGYKSIKYLFQAKDSAAFYAFLVILSLTAKLFVSDTFWGDQNFWILLAMILTIRPSPAEQKIPEQTEETVRGEVI